MDPVTILTTGITSLTDTFEGVAVPAIAASFAVFGLLYGKRLVKKIVS